MSRVAMGTLLLALGLAGFFLLIVRAVPDGFEGLFVIIFMLLMGSTRRLPRRLRLRLDNALDIVWSAFGVGFLGYLVGRDPLNHLDQWAHSVVLVWAAAAMAGVLAIVGYAGLIARARDRDDASDRPASQPPSDTPQ